MAPVRARLTYRELSDLQVGRLSQELESMGFRVLSCSKHGISFAGEQAKFEQEFRCTVRLEADGRAVAESHPQVPGTMAVPEAAVYLPSRPELHP